MTAETGVAVAMMPARSALMPQRGGFLSDGPHPFTHSLSPYVGCGFGRSACGRFCYARWLPAWQVRADGTAWGERVWVKQGLDRVLADELGQMSPDRRAHLRIFLSPATDPYQPLEARWRVTRRLLEVFAAVAEPDLLVVQTRSPLARRDLDLLSAIPYALLSITLETDAPQWMRASGGGPPVAARLALIRQACRAGIATQVAVSPCLPYTPAFAAQLADLGVLRVVVDTVVDGDGSGGRRTARAPFGREAGWNRRDHALALYEALRRRGVPVGWSAAGFAGVAPGVVRVLNGMPAAPAAPLPPPSPAHTPVDPKSGSAVPD